MPDRPPLAVLLNGAPGSGKTTLADVLAPALNLPVLHNDALDHGAWRTRDRSDATRAVRRRTLLSHHGVVVGVRHQLRSRKDLSSWSQRTRCH
ncbi:MAG: AAA family ATPase [Acidimicrobiales bacterium]